MRIYFPNRRSHPLNFSRVTPKSHGQAVRFVDLSQREDSGIATTDAKG